MADPRPISTLIGLSPEETVRAFEARDTLRTTVRWDEMLHSEHARAFTVAKVAKLDMLAEIQASLADVIANGGTLEQWQGNLIPYLKSKGWWGNVTDRALTGTDEMVKVGPHRLRTIYDTNLRVSRAAGRWERIQQLKVQRPFLRYVAVLDARTRPAHRAWHGTILPVDHPWWDTHYPPCGWYCRCTVRQLSQRELDAKGWKVTAVPPEGPPQMFFPAGRTTPVSVPAGISPGFGYNAGTASMAATADKATRSIEAAAATDLAAARETLDALVQSEAFPQAIAEPGTRFPIMVLPPEIAGDAPQVATISGEVASGLLAPSHRPAVGLDELRQLPAIGASPNHALIADDGKLTLVKKVGDRYLAADLAPVTSPESDQVAATASHPPRPGADQPEAAPATKPRAGAPEDSGIGRAPSHGKRIDPASVGAAHGAPPDHSAPIGLGRSQTDLRPGVGEQAAENAHGLARSGAVDTPAEVRRRRLILLRQPFPWALLVLRWMEGQELGELLASLDDLLS